MTKPVRRIAISACTILILGLVLIATIVTTETGSSWVVKRLTPSIMENLTIKTVRGDLFSGLKLHKVSHTANQIKTTIDDVVFAWHPLSLFRGKLHIANLEIKGVSIFLPRSSAALSRDIQGIAKMISIPVPAVLKSARLQTVEFHLDDKVYKLPPLFLSGQVDQKGIRIDRLRLWTKKAQFSTRGRIGFKSPYPIRQKMDWRWIDPENRPVQGSCDIEGTMKGAKATFRLGLPFVVETSAELKPNKDWTKLYLIGTHIDGKQQNPIDLSDTTKTASVYFNQLKCHTLGGSVTLDGHMSWQPEPIMRLSIHGENINPGILSTNWPGKLEFQTNLMGQLSSEAININLSELKMMGRLLDQPFESSGSLTIYNNQPTLVQFDLLSGNNRLKLSGTSEKTFNLRFNLQVLEPESLWPGMEGKWRAQGSVKPFEDTPTGALVLDGKDITYGNLHIESYQGDITCGEAAPQKCGARIKLINLQMDGETFPSLSIDWMGDLRDHRVQADLVSSTARINLGFKGACHSDTWQFSFDNASFNMANNDPWHLDKPPAKVLVDHTGIKPFNACWAQKNSSACMEGAWNTLEGWKTSGDLDAPPLNRILDILNGLIQRPKLDQKFYTSGKIDYQ